MGAPEIANSLEELVASVRELLSTSNRDSLQQTLLALAHLADYAGRSRRADAAGPGRPAGSDGRSARDRGAGAAFAGQARPARRRGR